MKHLGHMVTGTYTRIALARTHACNAYEFLSSVHCKPQCKSSNGPFHLMSVPPLLRVNYKFYPLGKKRSKCRRIPPFRKRQMFSRDQRYRHSYPLRNDFKNPLPLPRISLTLNRGGADIKWNGPMASWCLDTV